EKTSRMDTRTGQQDPGSSEDALDRPVEGRGHGRGGRNREDPGADDVPGDPPTYRRQPLRRAGAEDGARDDVRRGQRVAVLRGRIDGRASCGLSGESALGLNFVEPLSERAHDPPTADISAERD